MAYEDDERIIDPDEQSNFFEEDPAYGTDTYFGERLDAMKDDLDLDEPEVEDMAEEDTVVIRPEEQEFGETIEQDAPGKVDSLDDEERLNLEDDEPHV